MSAGVLYRLRDFVSVGIPPFLFALISVWRYFNRDIFLSNNSSVDITFLVIFNFVVYMVFVLYALIRLSGIYRLFGDPLGYKYSGLVILLWFTIFLFVGMIFVPYGLLAIRGFVFCPTENVSAVFQLLFVVSENVYAVLVALIMLINKKLYFIYLYGNARYFYRRQYLNEKIREKEKIWSNSRFFECVILPIAILFIIPILHIYFPSMFLLPDEIFYALLIFWFAFSAQLFLLIRLNFNLFDIFSTPFKNRSKLFVLGLTFIISYFISLVIIIIPLISEEFIPWLVEQSIMFDILQIVFGALVIIYWLGFSDLENLIARSILDILDNKNLFVFIGHGKEVFDMAVMTAAYLKAKHNPDIHPGKVMSCDNGAQYKKLIFRSDKSNFVTPRDTKSCFSSNVIIITDEIPVESTYIYSIPGLGDLILASDTTNYGYEFLIPVLKVTDIYSDEVYLAINAFYSKALVFVIRDHDELEKIRTKLFPHLSPDVKIIIHYHSTYLIQWGASS